MELLQDKDGFAGRSDDLVQGVDKEAQHAPHLPEKPKSQLAQFVHE